MEISHGPWKEIFSGKWTDYQVHFYENPDKITLMLIEDKKEGTIRGSLAIAYKTYVVEGESSVFAEKVPGNTIVLEKHYPSFKGNYLILSPGPKYVKVGESMNMAMDDMFRKLEEISEKVQEESAAFDIRVIPLKNAGEEYADRLFSEPFLLPSTLIRKAVATPQPTEVKTMAKALLGRRITGELADENIQSFASTIIVGNSKQQKDAAHVILENCVLTGITAIILDEDKEFTSMGAPNKRFNQQEYPNLQPIGMPLNNLEIGKINVNINQLKAEQFRELLEIPRNEKGPGEEAAKMIDQATETHTETYSSLKGMEEEILSNAPDAKKFHAYRAIRIIRTIHKAYPNMLSGKIDLNVLVSPYLKRVGSIIRVDVSQYPPLIRRALALSILKSLYEKYKAELSSRELKVLAFLPTGTDYVTDTPIGREIKNILLDSVNYGVGACMGIEHEEEIDATTLKNASMIIKFTSEREIAVKEVHSRPYRAKLRDRLSA